MQYSFQALNLMTLRQFFMTLAFALPGSLSAQVIWTDPPLPTQATTVTVFYDASQGNGALAGTSAAVYAHTGVITDKSTGPSDWKFVQGTWGTDDPDVRMTSLGGDVYSITYNINTFYNVPVTDTVFEMAFVFRNAAGDVVGRDADGSDIYTQVFRNELNVSIINPSSDLTILEPGEDLDVRVAGLLSDSLFLFDNDMLVQATDAPELDVTITPPSTGLHTVRAVAKSGSASVEQTRQYYVRPPVQIAALPPGVDHGVNIIDDSTVTLVLYAPFKDYVFVLGDWNNWQPGDEGYLFQDPDGETWWTTVTGLDPHAWQRYQYLIDGNLQLADYMAELVLDPNNDAGIPDASFPDIPEYPERGLGYVSVFRIQEEPYVWNVTDFVKPAPGDLVVYELHIRDFLSKRNYQTVLDTLPYLQRLGINAIEFMPLNEFEGNESWGYNPSFHGALDKYYGTKNDLKRLIDTCHARGMAVILDMVLNHAFGQSPMVRMYWDSDRPAINSPWFNQVAKHDFNVGFDFNHESPATQKYTKDMLRYWIEEYKFDGYRMDLSKGFTQNNTLGNIGAWNAYDPTRVALWKDYSDYLWSVDPTAYMILEHFSDNTEERELANYGMMFWGNINHDYRNLAKGSGSSNVSWGLYTSRGWNDPHLLSFMESHDEERMMYTNLTEGNTSEAPDYNIRDLRIGLFRCELAAALFFPQPGAKMLWQFGELGYDLSINFNGRTGNKPVRWNYYEEHSRRRLFQVYSALINLRMDYPEVFGTTDFVASLAGIVKRINLNHPDMNVTVIGNVAVTEREGVPAFQHTGWWYDFFSGDSLNVTDLSASITLEPGAYHVFTDVRLAKPELLSGIGETPGPLGWTEIYPNPANPGAQFAVQFELGKTAEVTASILDLQGRLHSTTPFGTLPAGMRGQTLQAPQQPGMYIVELRSEEGVSTARLLVQ